MDHEERSRSASWYGERRKKYRTATGADTDRRPAPGTRQECYVNGYTKRDGTRVKGHMRKIRPG